MIFRRCFFFRRRIISVSLDSRVAFHSRLATRLFTRDAFLILAPKYQCDTFLFINFEKSLPPNCSRYRNTLLLARIDRTKLDSPHDTFLRSFPFFHSWIRLVVLHAIPVTSRRLFLVATTKNSIFLNFQQIFFLLIFNLGWNKIQEILKAASSSKQLQSINQYNNNSLLIS